MRRSKDWTQADLGKLIGCTGATIRKIEAEERLPSKQLTEKLADLFRIPPQERERFQHFARGDAHSAVIEPGQAAKWSDTRSSHRSNLPWPATSLVGREQAVADVRDYLLDPAVRLVTLVGPPGIGKTRLSIAGARDIQANFEDEVFFIPLSRLGDSSSIASLVLQIMEYVETDNVSTSQQLARDPRERNTARVRQLRAHHYQCRVIRL